MSAVSLHRAIALNEFKSGKEPLNTTNLAVEDKGLSRPGGLFGNRVMQPNTVLRRDYLQVRGDQMVKKPVLV